MSRPTVTLCMIVKDEEHIIEECLQSIYKHIDRYDITDTGSSDSTKEIITKFFEKKNIPGKIYDEPWQGFGKSRTKSLKNAESGGAEWAWVIDADDKLAGDFVYPNNMNSYDALSLNIFRGNFNWWRNQIFKLSSGWEYVGVIHEYADAIGLREKTGKNPNALKHEGGNYFIDARTMGNRSKEFENNEQQKYLKDAETIRSCLEDADNPNYEPHNLRYKFYLAQSYFDGGDYEKAYAAYKVRADAGGWEEEQWYSVFRMGMCMITPQMQELDPHAWQKAQDHFMQAYNIRPGRAEPLLTLARTHRLNNNPRIAFMYARQALKIPFPKDDILFLVKSCYDWEILDECAATAHTVGEWNIGFACSQKLVQERKYPEEHHERMIRNYQSYEQYMIRSQQGQVQIAKESEEEKQKRTQIRIEKAQEKKKNKARLDRRKNKKSRSR